MKENENVVKLKSCVYKLYEMQDELNQTISTIKQAEAEQIALIECVDNYKGNADLTEFKEHLIEAVKESKQQRTVLEIRFKLLSNTIMLYEQNEAIKNVTDTLISQLLIVVGICAPEVINDEKKQDDN